MFGKCSSGSTSSSGKFRLPPPIFAVPDKHLSSQSEVQRTEIGQDSGYLNDLNNPKFSQSNNPWTNGGAPGQSNRKERFAKPHKPKFQSPRNSYNAYKPRGRGSSSFYCDSCDRGFSTHEELQYHIGNEHVTCGLDGCTLSAHPKVVEKHQKIQHLSGLYLRLMSNSSKNPEDVSKWIAERKKNYPTTANIERRKEVNKERLERGETLEPDRRRFGRFGGRIQPRGSQGRGGKGIQRDRRRPRTHSQSKEGGAPRGKRGRGRSGPWKISERIFHQKTEKSTGKEEIESEWEDKKGIPMFCGTAILFGTPLKKEESSDEEIVEDEGEFSDSEWLLEDGAAKCKDAKKDEKCASADGNLSKPNKDTVVLNNALGLLIGTYGSDDSNSDEEDSKAESKPPAKRVCMGDKSDNQQKPPSVTTEKKTEVISLPSNALTVETVDVEENSDGSGPEVVYIKKAPIEHVISSNKVADEIVTVEDGSNDSAPEVVSIKRVSKEEVGIANEDEKRNGKEDDRMENEGRKRARRSRKRGRTRGERGGKRDGKKGLEEEDETEEAGAEDVGRAARERKQKELNQPQRYPTLLEELLKDEIRHERNAILQCIRYVVENNFFDEVEEISPKEVVPEDESASNGDSKNKSLEMLSVNELQSVSNGSNNDVMITVSVEGKIEDITSLSGNHDCEMEEPNSCIIDGQKESDVVKGTSHEMESSSQECEGTEKMVLEKERSSNNSMSQAVNDSQSTSDCSRKDISNSNETDGRSSEISQLESKDSMKCQNSSITNNENVSGVKKSKSSKKVDSALQEKEKSLEQKTSNRETENVSPSPMSNDVQLTNNVFQNDEIVTKGKRNESSALEQDKGLTEEHEVSLSAEEGAVDSRGVKMATRATTSDVGENESEEAMKVTALHLIKIGVGFILFFVDIFFDITAAIEMYYLSSSGFFSAAVFFIIAPAIITNVISWLWMYDLFWYALKLFREKIPTTKSTMQRFSFWYADIALIGMMEALLESDPQTILQLSRIIPGNPDDNFNFGVKRTCSAVFSFVAVGFAIASYHVTIRMPQSRKKKISSYGYMIHWIWHLLITASRVISMACLLTVLPVAVLIGGLIHIGLALVYLRIPGIGPERTFDSFFRDLGLHLLIAFGYLFYAIPVHDGPSHKFYITMYLVFFFENGAAVVYWYLQLSNYLALILLIFSFSSFVFGIIFMLVYYKCFHPTQSDTAKRSSSPYAEVPQDEVQVDEAVQNK